MTRPSTLEHVLDLSLSLEQSAETFYRALAERFAHCPEAAAFWKHYADEEAGHARWVQGLRQRTEAALLRQPLDGVDAVIDGAYRLLEVPPELLAAQISDLEEAYRMAISMEDSETNAIFEFLVTDYATSAHSRDFLRAQIHDHAGKIKREFPIREIEARRAIRAGS